jgi:hypothetical protein
LIWLLNIAAFIVITAIPSINRTWFGLLSSINLTIAVLVRQDFVINALYAILCSVPKSWPLFIRARCAKIYHLGGVHSGAASSAVFWHLASLIYNMRCTVTKCPSTQKHASVATFVFSWFALALLAGMLAFAWPLIRKKHYDIFELVHRFGGWTVLAIIWVQTVLFINDTRRPSIPLGRVCIASPNIWLLAVATTSIFTSWLSLRQVPVEAEVLSDHAVRLHFDYAITVNGTFTRVSESPLLEWHSFATIPAPEATANYPRGH